VISFTAPENLEGFSQDNMATKSGATVTYGPFNSIPPSTNQNFISQYQQPVVVHYYHDQPVLEVVQLRRSAEISHWGANLNVEDNIHLHNAGPT
jgi:oligosaccharyltransferase complex subunit alpha (ribophorin I)